jgi:phage gp46-like protein
LRLCVKKGSFEQDPSLGSELFKLSNLRGANIERIALSYAQEALRSMPEVTVTGVSVRREAPEAILLRVSLIISEKIVQLEVDIT